MTDDATPRILQAIQDRLANIERKIEESAVTTNRSIGKLAEGILQLRTTIDSQGTDIHTMMLTLREHGERLSALEKRQPQ
ncbi:MAG: hypothetical protein HY053_06580 [Proteobacteria bacterium]|nr:hypothetical protein [Pseudomonadota bacterium]